MNGGIYFRRYYERIDDIVIGGCRSFSKEKGWKV